MTSRSGTASTITRVHVRVCVSVLVGLDSGPLPWATPPAPLSKFLLNHYFLSEGLAKLPRLGLRLWLSGLTAPDRVLMLQAEGTMPGSLLIVSKQDGHLHQHLSYPNWETLIHSLGECFLCTYDCRSVPDSTVSRCGAGSPLLALPPSEGKASRGLKIVVCDLLWDTLSYLRDYYCLTFHC